VDGEGGGEARGAEDHRLAQIEPGGQRHDPVARHPHHLREAAVLRFAEPHPVDEDGVAGREPRVGRRDDAARHVDARVDGEALVDAAAAGDAQGVFEVDARPLGADGDRPGTQVVLGHFHHARRHHPFLLEDSASE
jgi:hypothetical protein